MSKPIGRNRLMLPVFNSQHQAYSSQLSLIKFHQTIMKPSHFFHNRCYQLFAALLLFAVTLTTDSTAQNADRRQIAFDFPSTTYVINAAGLDIDHYYDNNHNYLNGYVITGFKDYFNPLTQTYFDKANLTRLTSCGDVYWSRDLNLNVPNYETRGASVRQTSDGGFIIAGSVKHATTTGWDILLVKADQYGGVTWSKRFNGFYAGDDHATAVREVYNPSTGSFDGFILTGAVDEYTDYLNPLAFPDCDPEYDNATLVVIRTDVIGNILWHQTIKPNIFGCFPPQTIPDYHHYSYGHDIEQVVDGNGNFINQFVVTGTVKDPTYYTYGEGCFALPCQNTNKKALLMSLTDNAGSGHVLNWVRNYPIPTRNGVAGNTTGYSVRQTSNGYVVAGTSDFARAPTLDQDVYLLETDPNGLHTISYTYDAGAVERGKSIEVTQDYYYIFGSFGVLNPGTGFLWDGLITKISRLTHNQAYTERYGSPTGRFDILDRSLPGSRRTIYGNRYHGQLHSHQRLLLPEQRR